MTGIELIAAERERQVSVEGWTTDHDRIHHSGDLTAAACTYGLHAMRQIDEGAQTQAVLNGLWPWSEKWWKPSPDPVRNLVKAGALIAAEIDRLQRINKEG